MAARNIASSFATAHRVHGSTLAEIADHLRIGLSTAWRDARRGEFQGERLGSDPVFPLVHEVGVSMQRVNTLATWA